MMKRILCLLILCSTLFACSSTELQYQNTPRSGTVSAAETIPLPVVPSDILYGDVDYNGRVEAADALELLRITVCTSFIDDEDLPIADVSGDYYSCGEWVINAVDALLVLQLVVGKITIFPVQELYAQALLPPSDTLPITQLKEGKTYAGIPTKQFSFDPVAFGHSAVQGTCWIDGEFYVAMSNRSGETEQICIGVFNQTGTLLRKSPILDLNHANNLSYNPDLGKIVVSHCQGDEESDYYTYSLLDPDTFEITKTEVKDFPFFSMAYSPEKQQYASGRWSGQTIDICDKNMNLIKTVDVTTPKSMSQGVFADGQYIYFIRSYLDDFGSELLIYDWDAKLIFQIPIAGMQNHEFEPENINIVDGTAYIFCNSSNYPGGHCFILTFREA